MRSQNLKQDSHDDWCSNHQIPSGIKFIKWSNQEVFDVIFFNLIFGETETVVSQDYDPGSIDILGEEYDHDCEGCALVGILSLVDILSDDINENVKNQIYNSDENC